VSDAPSSSFGEGYSLTPVDRFGIWLSARRLRHEVGTFDGKRVGDFGCGYDATFVRSVLGEVASAALVDVTLAPDLREHPKVTAVEGTLPEALAKFDDASLDVVMCTSVLEHLWEPQEALREFRRLLAPGGTCLLNVPTWLGKRALELSAFRLGLSPADSIDDHKAYYDPRDLWPMLVRAGFRPQRIRCFRHKFGLNTFASCRVDS
jgi:SAM-dependent methyltransferase